MSVTQPTQISKDCEQSGGVPWSNLLGYLGASTYEESTILPEIALSLNEVSGKWNIFTRELFDNLQCGQTQYRIDDVLLSNQGLYVDDVLFVSAGGVCFTEAENHCGYVCNTYKYDENNCTITLSDAPMTDVKNGLVVRVRLNMDVNTSCCLPKKFIKKYGNHIINYMLYKRAIRNTSGEKLSATQATLLYRDAVEYFNREQWVPWKGISVNVKSSKRINLC